MLESGHSTEVLIFNLFVILVLKDGVLLCVGARCFFSTRFATTLLCGMNRSGACVCEK